jgi:hypothetical protein
LDSEFFISGIQYLLIIGIKTLKLYRSDDKMAELNIDPYWQAFIKWFSGIPLFGQILIIAGAVAIIVLVLIGVYYILKGLAYLIYYLFKGLYYLLKAIAKGFYKLFEALYYAITGKEKPIKQDQPEKNDESPVIVKEIPKTIIYPETQSISFCSECGSKFSESMMAQLNTKGQVFCIHCGNGIHVDAANISS